jgi:hypothetical protein
VQAVPGKNTEKNLLKISVSPVISVARFFNPSF